MNLPFRADHVGSLLRPEKLKQARSRFLGPQTPTSNLRGRLRSSKRVVLGLVSSKKPQLEDKNALVKRIEEASRFAPLEQLALSPQCGFASSIQGNPLSEAEQEAKLRRIVEVAGHIWGSA